MFQLNITNKTYLFTNTTLIILIFLIATKVLSDFVFIPP